MNDRTRLADRPPLIFAGSPLDRADRLRRDEAEVSRVLSEAEGWWLVLDGGDPLLTPDGNLFWMDRGEIRSRGLEAGSLLLGYYRGTPCFTVATEELALPPDADIVDTRRAAMGLSQDEAAMLALAKSLTSWHARHGFCANCGVATAIHAGGYRRACPACETEHFPRVDPVVIMLATDGDRCLLGRQAAWPAEMWSALAGFVEPAETLEEACARELHEEAGVVADIPAIRYVMAQPWPFPSSLMVGLVAPVTQSTVHVDEHELEQARWFSRDEVRAMLDGTHPDAAMPPSIAIARRLTELWVDGAI